MISAERKEACVPAELWMKGTRDKTWKTKKWENAQSPICGDSSLEILIHCLMCGLKMRIF